jgi:hypothetical protein
LLLKKYHAKGLRSEMLNRCLLQTGWKEILEFFVHYTLVIFIVEVFSGTVGSSFDGLFSEKACGFNSSC